MDTVMGFFTNVGAVVAALTTLLGAVMVLVTTLAGLVKALRALVKDVREVQDEKAS
jgi:hypothetical protein